MNKIYSIELKSGHTYNFFKYKNPKFTKRNGVLIFSIDIQEEKYGNYRTIKMIYRTIKKASMEIDYGKLQKTL